MNAPILIVDDEPDMCWAMAHILQSRGHKAVTALNAADALALLERGEFSVVFLDAKLPDMDGLEVARSARAVTPGKLRVVLVSGYHYHDDPVIRKAMDEGVICAFLAKPFAASDLLKALPADIEK